MKCNKCNKEFKGVVNQSICSECLKKGKNKSKKLKTPNTIRTNPKKLKTPNTIRTNLFTNPSNNITVQISSEISWLWVLLFGPIYWAIKGVWTHVVAGFCLSIVTFGISVLVYPFFTYSILRKHYINKGWEPAE
tara:strand:+ start:64 stop:465 length:402 start_codon:yes stop_codon:yes gene_type:complete